MYYPYLRYLMVAGIGAIAAAALYSIVVVLTGSFGEFQVKVIVTTLVLGFYALTCAATFGEGIAMTVLGSIGLSIAVFGLLTTLPVIWVEYGWRTPEVPYKSILSLALISFALAHGAINFRLSSSSIVSGGVMVVTNAAVTIVTLMLLHLIMGDFREISEAYVRFLIVFVILDVALTIVNFIVAKLFPTSVVAA